MADWSGGEAEDKIACFQAITGVDDLDLAVSSFTSNPDPITNFNFNSLTSPTTSQPYDSMDSPPPPPHPPESSTIAWKLVNLPFYAVSGGVNLISGAIGIGFWIAGGVLSRSLNLLGLLPPHSGGNIRATEGFKVCNSLKASRFPFCAVVMASTNQRIVMLSQSKAVLRMTHHRMAESNFKDPEHIQIVNISLLTSLRQLKNDVSSALKQLAVYISLRCSSYDFIGTSVTGSSEEFGTVQEIESSVQFNPDEVEDSLLKDKSDEDMDRINDVEYDSVGDSEVDQHAEELNEGIRNNVIFVVGDANTLKTALIKSFDFYCSRHHQLNEDTTFICYVEKEYNVIKSRELDFPVEARHVVRGVVLTVNLDFPPKRGRVSDWLDAIQNKAPDARLVVMGTRHRLPRDDDSIIVYAIEKLIRRKYPTRDPKEIFMHDGVTATNALRRVADTRYGVP